MSKIFKVFKAFTSIGKGADAAGDAAKAASKAGKAADAAGDAAKAASKAGKAADAAGDAGNVAAKSGSTTGNIAKGTGLLFAGVGLHKFAKDSGFDAAGYLSEGVEEISDDFGDMLFNVIIKIVAPIVLLYLFFK